MRAFWDRRAREDPLYFIDNRLRYGHPDRERFWARGEEDLEALLAALGVELGPTDTVVEIGCGVGRLTRGIAARARRVVALDVSPRMIELARVENASLDEVTWLEGDGRSLRGIADGVADACLSHVVFQHIPDPAVTLGYVAEMGRVLRPGGWAGFGVSNDPRVHRSPAPRPKVASRLAGRLGRGPREQAHPAWLGSAVALSDVRSAAARGGMRVERVSGEGTQFCLVLARRTAI